MFYDRINEDEQPEKDACFYCEAAERQMATPSLFDMLAEPEPDAETCAAIVA